MPLVKGPVERVLLSGLSLLGEARAALAGSTTCTGVLFGFGRDLDACRSVAGSIDQVEQRLLELETRRRALDESKGTSVSEAQRLVNLANGYVEQLRYAIRTLTVKPQWSIEPSFRGFGELVRAVLRELSSLVVDIGKGAAQGLAEGLGFWGLLAIGAVLYFNYGKRAAA